MDKKTVKELKLIAKALNISGYSGLRKAELIQAIENAEEEPEHVLEDGEEIGVPSSTDYEEATVKRIGNGYKCSCESWRLNKSPDRNKKRCSHIRGLFKGQFKLIQPEEDNGVNDLPKLMLAHTYEEDKDVRGWFVSEKLDGIRAYWDGTKLYTRTGKEIFAPKEFLNGLPKFLKLDGELTAGRGNFDITCSITKRHIPNVADWMKMIKYSVFDVLYLCNGNTQNLPFSERFNLLKRFENQICLLNQDIIKGTSDVTTRLNNVIKLGGEGLMLRKPDSIYIGKRSNCLLKVKKFLDCEGKIIGYKGGTNKYIGMMGALECELKSGVRVFVGSGYTDEQRRDPPPIGTFITIKYFELSKKGIPRFPTFLRVAERQMF